MNNKKKSITTGLVAICVMAAGVYVYNNRDTKSVTPPARDEVLEDDLKVLDNSKGSTQYQIYAALVRLAQTGNKVAYIEALKRHKDTQPWVRAGAGMALSYFSDKNADRIIQELVNDPEAIVREKTFEGLSLNAQNPERKALLAALMNDTKRPASEKVQLKLGVLKQNGDQQSKNQVLQEIFTLLKELSNEKKIPVVQSLVASESRNEMLGQYLKSLLETEKSSPDLTAVLVNSLSIAQPDKIRNSLPTYIQSESENIRIAAVNGFLYSCPPGVVTALGDLIKNDKSELVVKSSLQVLSGFPREESRKIFLSLKGKKLSPGVEQAYIQAFKAFEINKAQDPCIK